MFVGSVIQPGYCGRSQEVPSFGVPEKAKAKLPCSQICEKDGKVESDPGFLSFSQAYLV